MNDIRPHLRLQMDIEICPYRRTERFAFTASHILTE